MKFFSICPCPISIVIYMYNIYNIIITKTLSSNVGFAINSQFDVRVLYVLNIH